MFKPVHWLVVCLFLPGALVALEKEWVVGKAGGFSSCSMSGTRTVRDSDGTEAVSLAHNEYEGRGAECLMHFNRITAGRFPVAGQSMRVYRQSVLVDRATPGMGRGSALFLWPSQYIDLQPGPGSLFRESTDIGSFSIEFRIHPFSNYDGEPILSRYGPFTRRDGSTLFGGIRAFFHRRRLRWDFSNFFRTAGGEYRPITLTARTPSMTRQWQHQALTYDHFTGKLTVWVDGVEDRVIWATETGNYGGTPLIPAFHDNLQIRPRIGGGFQGKLDEFRITRAAEQRFRIHRYRDARGVVVSDVHDMKESHGRLLSLTARVHEPGGSAVFLEYRISETVFEKSDTRMPWIRVRNGERRFPSGAHGRYVQWRAILVGADSGKYSPLLRSVSIRYRPARTLFRPAGLVAVAGDGRVTLSWTPNMDRIDGYRIYVGTRPGEYLDRNPIRVSLQTIESGRPRFVVYGLENDRLYYFAVTAYDSKGQGHESPFSREVYARPSFLLGKNSANP